MKKLDRSDLSLESRSAVMRANEYRTRLEGRHCFIREMDHWWGVSDK